jgi:hypothetical protein
VSLPRRQLRTAAKEKKMADKTDYDENQLQFPFIVNGKPRRAASPITDEAKATIFTMHAEGFIQSDIAAVIGTNQGRVSEVLRGLR